MVLILVQFVIFVYLVKFEKNNHLTKGAGLVRNYTQPCGYRASSYKNGSKLEVTICDLKPLAQETAG